MAEFRIKARFFKGIIEPLEKLDLEEGEELKITISPISKKKSMIEALRRTFGGWKDLIDAEELKRNIYSDRLITTRNRGEK
mgnify:CR=1 FL=1